MGSKCDFLMLVLKQLVLLYALLLLSTPVSAQNTNIQWHGFMTAGVTYNDSKWDYIGGVTPKQNWTNLYKFGLNLNYKINHKLNLAAQMMTETKNTDLGLKGDYAIANYRFNDSVFLKIGRYRLNVWLISDHSDVGNSYPWVTPPTEVYSVLPLRSINGFTATYRVEFSSFVFKHEVLFGETREQIAIGNPDNLAELDVKEVMGGAMTVTFPYFSMKSAYFHTNTSIQTNTFYVPATSKDFMTFGVMSENSNFLLMSEYAKVSEKNDSELKTAENNAEVAEQKAEQTNTPLDNEDASTKRTQADILKAKICDFDSYYVTLGYQIEDYLPHITFSKMTATDSGYGFDSQSTMAYGLRYNVNAQSDVKLEYRKIKPRDDAGKGLFYTNDASVALTPPGRTNIYMISYDLVF